MIAKEGLSVDELAKEFSKVLILVDVLEGYLTDYVGYLRGDIKHVLKGLLAKLNLSRKKLETLYKDPSFMEVMGTDSDKLRETFDKLLDEL